MTMQLPTGLTLAQVNVPPTAEEWNATALDIADTVGLPTTTFEDGGVERTIFAVVSNMQQQADVASSVAIQGGFLNFAAFGTVSWTDSTGAAQTAYVTPDPSIPSQNPTGALGWLDVLADGLYDVRRLLISPAGGALAILNTQAVTYGPFVPGSYHVSQPGVSGAPGYSNAASLTIPQSATLGTVSATSSSGGAVRLNSAGAWTVGQIVFVDGVKGTIEANGAWVVSITDGTTYIVLSGSAFANAYVSGGTIYAPTIGSFTADVGGTGSNALPNKVSHSVTSLIGVTVSNYMSWVGANTESNASVVNRCGLKLASLSPNGPKGAYLYFALATITLGPTLSPPANLSTAITSALVSSTNGVVTVTIANGAGAPSDADVLAVDAVIQAFADPVSVSEFTQKCSNLNTTVAVTIYVPKNKTTIVVHVVQVAVQTYLLSVPVGGIIDPGGPSNVVPIQGLAAAISAACSAAQIPVQDMAITLNGVAANLAVGATQYPVFINASTFTPTVVGY